MADYRATEDVKRRLGQAVDLLDQAQDLIAKARQIAEDVECEVDNEIGYDIQESRGEFSAAEETVSDLRRGMEGTWLNVEVVAEEDDSEEAEG
jgi:uncharacterized protein YoxC